jgi:hypothetical protein
MSYMPTARRIVATQKPKSGFRSLKGLGFAIDDPHRWSRLRLRSRPALGSLGGGGMLLIGVAVVGIIGLIVYTGFKTRQSIIEKHGVEGALKYEAGTQAIGLLGQWLSPRQPRRNKRRSRRRRRR